MQPNADQIQGFKRVMCDEPYALTTKNKVAMILSSNPEFEVFTVLLVRKTTVIAAVRDAKGVAIKKIELDRTIVPVNSNYWIYEPEVAVDTAPTKEKRVKVALEGGITKIQRCRELFAANAQLDKAAMIDLFVREAQCTPMGANTYYITCRKS